MFVVRLDANNDLTNLLSLGELVRGQSVVNFGCGIGTGNEACQNQDTHDGRRLPRQHKIGRVAFRAGANGASQMTHERVSVLFEVTSSETRPARAPIYSRADVHSDADFETPSEM